MARSQLPDVSWDFLRAHGFLGSEDWKPMVACVRGRGPVLKETVARFQPAAVQRAAVKLAACRADWLAGWPADRQLASQFIKSVKIPASRKTR